MEWEWPDCDFPEHFRVLANLAACRSTLELTVTCREALSCLDSVECLTGLGNVMKRALVT